MNTLASNLSKILLFFFSITLALGTWNPFVPFQYEMGGGNGYDQEFPITRSIGWKINKNDSIAIISCPVNLILRYDHFNNGESVVYNGHANESIINVVVRGGNCYKVRDKLSYRVTLSADYIDQHDSSPNDTIAVEAYIDGSINMYLK